MSTPNEHDAVWSAAATGDYKGDAPTRVLRRLGRGARPARVPVGRHLSTLRGWLPQGQLLPDDVWYRRHAMIVVLLWLHVVGLSLFGLARGQSAAHMLVEAIPLALAAAVAGWEWAGLRLRVAAASFGLITSSAVLVHLPAG